MEFLGAGMQKIPGLGDAGKSVFGAGLETQWKAIDFGAMGDALIEQAPSFQETLVQAGLDAANAIKDTFDGIEGIDIFSQETSNKLEDLRALWQEAQSTVEANKEKLQKPEAKGTANLGVVAPKIQSQSFEAITSSLGKIGGGGISRGTTFTVSPMVDQQKETNKLLRQNNQLMLQSKTVTTSKEASIYG